MVSRQPLGRTTKGPIRSFLQSWVLILPMLNQRAGSRSMYTSPKREREASLARASGLYDARFQGEALKRPWFLDQSPTTASKAKVLRSRQTCSFTFCPAGMPLIMLIRWFSLRIPKPSTSNTTSLARSPAAAPGVEGVDP